jgi:hypothetical protein
MRQAARFLSLILILLLNTITPHAQSIQSTILGTVKDQGGAVIVGAQVVIINTATSRTASYLTDANGNFQATDLPPGKYQLDVSMGGFQRKTISDLAVSARQQFRVDVTLAVGATQQEVTVDASTAGAIETETPSIASTLNTESVMNLPVNTRASGSTSPLNMVQALPGVQSDNGLNFSVQGGLPFQTETSVDGVSTQNVTSNSPLADAFPSSESIAELRVDGVNNNAEFGQAGEITTITKSGGNNLHGSLFWYHQNRALDAVGYGAPVDPVTGKVIKPQKIGNDFGASAGGPLVIPHIYNGHDKTFFFGTFEGFRFPKQSTIQNLVPTEAMLKGDFSQEIPLDMNDPSTWLIDPSTFMPYFLSSGDNIIPQINQSAKPFLSLFPKPNAGKYQTVLQAEQGLGYNYTDNRDSSYHSNQFDARLDHHFNQKLQAFGRYTFKNVTNLSPQDLNIPSVTYFDNYRILASSLIYSFTPNLLSEFRFGFTDESNGRRNMFNGGPYTAAAGFQPIGDGYPVNGMTAIGFAHLTTLQAGNLNNTSQSRLFQYADNLTWTKGRHSAKFGFDIRPMQSVTTLGSFGLDNVTVFGFDGEISGNLLPNFSAAEFADYLSGAPGLTSYYTLHPENKGQSIYYGFYAQDQWNVMPNLTLSYGVRYEYHPAYNDETGSIGNFDPSVPGTGAVIYPTGYKNLLDSNYLKNFDACGYGPDSTDYAKCTPVLSSSEAHLPSSLRKSQKDRVLPRVGLAWRPFNDDKTAVRAGFGVYNTTMLGSIFFAMTNTLQAASLNMFNSLTDTGMAYMWPKSSPGLGGPQYGTSSFNTPDQIDWKDPYSMQWNLSVDHQFGSNIGSRISYIGMKTDDLVWTPDLNAMSYSTTTPATERDLKERPFPNWGAINSHLNGAQANYEALQVEVNHRTQHGVTFESAYTWAKNLADNSGSNSSSFQSENGDNSSHSTYLYDRALDYGNVNGTRHHRWSTTGVYELPFGHGRSFASNANGFENTIIGGWQLSGIFLWQTGPYLSAHIPSADADPSGTGSGKLYGSDQRPDIIGKTRPAHRDRNQWVNPQAFACPSNTGYTAASYAGNGNTCGVGVTTAPIGRFGNESIGDIVGPGTVNLSAGLSKRIEITEGLHLRAEGTFTNVLNHTNLNDPNLDINSPSFGKITSARGSDFGGNRTGQISMRLEF